MVEAGNNFIAKNAQTIFRYLNIGLFDAREMELHYLSIKCHVNKASSWQLQGNDMPH